MVGGGVVAEQLGPVHGSQQLAWSPAQAEPPLGALQPCAPFLMWHFLTPLAVVRQQVTKPGFPQVEFAAHFLTEPLQDLGSVPAFTAALTTARAHLTYARWPVAPEQLH